MQVHLLPTPAMIPIHLGQQQQLEDVTQFIYLGSLIKYGGDSEADVICRIGKASAVFYCLRPIWTSSTISLTIKLHLYTTIVLPTVTYGSETWKITVAVTRKVDVFHQRCLRRILGISYLDHITNVEVLRWSKMCRLSFIIAKRRLRLAGHVLRMDRHRITRRQYWEPLDAKLGRGRPKTNWRSTFKDDLK